MIPPCGRDIGSTPERKRRVPGPPGSRSETLDRSEQRERPAPLGWSHHTGEHPLGFVQAFASCALRAIAASDSV